MSVLIVVESCFGNTLTVARAVAAGLAGKLGTEAVRLQSAQDALGPIAAGVSLVLAGAPTHLMGLPDQKSRAQAVERGATEPVTTGLQEWIAAVTPDDRLRVLTFDTVTSTSMFSGSAAKAAAKAQRRRGFARAERGPSFVVKGTGGPLADGAEETARDWGARLGAELSHPRS